uniref:Uncharacterized protein n=3 Tax=Triticinae TaxID=1648030 RepID=A0A452ZRQ1_AEGTS
MVAVQVQSLASSTTLLFMRPIYLRVRMNKMKSHGSKHRGGSGGGGLSRMLREHKARLYIIRRCVVALLCYHD